MLSDAENPIEYLSLLPEDWKKEKLLAIREMVLSHNQLQESMDYKMLSYGHEGNQLFHLNAQKNYVSLYVGNIEKVPDGRELLKDLDLGKGCIRIKKSVNLEKTQLSEFIEKSVELWLKGTDLSC